MNHRLKILPEYFDAVRSGAKTFEVRMDDRPFQVGDLLTLCEFVPEAGGAITGREIIVKVIYILRGEYCKEGYCVLGIVRVGRWLDDEMKKGYLRCSVCNYIKQHRANYCECCGSEMEEEA